MPAKLRWSFHGTHLYWKGFRQWNKTNSELLFIFMSYFMFIQIKFLYPKPVVGKEGGQLKSQWDCTVIGKRSAVAFRSFLYTWPSLLD